MLKKFLINLSATVIALFVVTAGVNAATVTNVDVNGIPFLQSFDNDIAGGTGAGGDVIDDTYNFTAFQNSVLNFTSSLNHPDGPNQVGIGNLTMTWSVDGGAETIHMISDATGGVLLTNFFHALLDGEVGKLVVQGLRLDNGGGYTLTVSAVPLPPSVIAFGTAMLGVGFLARRRRKQKSVF